MNIEEILICKHPLIKGKNTQKKISMKENPVYLKKKK
jgi:hypothetical protein